MMWDTGVLLVILCIISGNLSAITAHSDGKPRPLPLAEYSVGRVYDLKVEHLNPTEVYVTWKFDLPPKIDEEYISFSIKLTSAASTRSRRLQYADLITEIYFDNLQVNTRYAIEVVAIYNLFDDPLQRSGGWKPHGSSRRREFVTWDRISPQLDTPTKLVAANLNPTDIQLAWMFEKPENVTSEGVVFWVDIREKVKRRHSLLLSSSHTSLTIRELLRDTVYMATIWATHPGFRDSLGLHGTFSTATPGEALSTPTNLQVRHTDTRTVTIAWDFSKPDDLRMYDIQFVVLLATINTSSGQSYRVVSKSKPFRQLRYRLNNLEANTTYSVRIHAFHPKKSDSAPLFANFTTMASNWSAPYITDVKRVILGDTEESANFEVTWNLNHSYWLHMFELQLDTSTSTKLFFGPDERSGKILVPYEEYFSVTVTACYSQPINGLIRRRSAHVESAGGMGRPSKVRNFMGMALGSKIVLRWDAPNIVRGPLTHYTVGVFDASPFIKYALTKFDTNETSVSIDALPLLGSEYAVIVWAVNVDKTHFTQPEEIFLGHPNHLAIPPYRPPPPSLINVRSGENYAEFSFSLNEKQPDTEYFVHYQTHHGIGYYTSFNATGRIDRLSPSQTVNITARTCFYYPNTRKLLLSCGCTCGVYSLVTAAAPPSRVLDVRRRSNLHHVFVITWEEPDSLNGPLDGYIISIVESGRPLPNITVDRNQRKYTFKDAKKSSQYKFGVAAFNYDLRTEEKVKVVGEFEWEAENHPGYLWIPGGCFILLALALLEILHWKFH